MTSQAVAAARSAPLRRCRLGRIRSPVARAARPSGVEPLGTDFEPLRLLARAGARRAAIKQVLLAGDIVVGVGNIYASEALFAAGIRPTLSAARLTCVRRAPAWRGPLVLARALEQGGSTLRDFERGRKDRLFPARGHGLRPRWPSLAASAAALPSRASAPGPALHLFLSAVPDSLISVFSSMSNASDPQPVSSAAFWPASLSAWSTGSAATGRHGLPWQGTRDPLPGLAVRGHAAQTQVATVCGLLPALPAALPDVQALAAATQEDVLAPGAAWATTAARAICRCAQAVVEQWGGAFPVQGRAA